MKNLSFRFLMPNDYGKEYLSLLEHLTTVNKETISLEKFTLFVENLHDLHIILVVEDPVKQLIIGSGTLLIEPKLIHSAGYVGHIEDLVVAPSYRHKNIGKNIVTKLSAIAREKNCYKVILDCAEEVKEFYQKCHFSVKELQMARYF